MLRGMKKHPVPGTLDMLDLLERYRGKSVEDPNLTGEDSPT
jgi:hypothetical protein